MASDFLGGISLLNTENLILLVIKFITDIIAIYLVSKVIYYRSSKNRAYVFTLFIFNITIFLVCSLLNNLTLSIGFSFGIFALFSVLRYRTTTIPIKEMTYLFVAISLAIINALINAKVSYAELLFTNIVLILSIYILEKYWVNNELMKSIVIEKIDLVKPGKYDELLSDLRERTGLDIIRIEIGKIDFLRDIANVRIYYHDSENRGFVNYEDSGDD